MLDGKVVVITGGGSGVGEAAGHRMAGEGASIVVVDIRDDAAERVAAEIERSGGTAQALTTDVSDDDAMRRMAADAVSRFGTIDVLMNNAALMDPVEMAKDGDIADMDVVVWDRVMAVNVRGTMLGCKHVVPYMVKAGSGVILNTASIGGLTGDWTHPAYNASKGAIIILTKCVATQYGAHGIRVNTIAPGAVVTPSAVRDDEAMRLSSAERLISRIGTPEDFAATAAFLASDGASYITGQTIVVDGGLTAHRPAYSINVWRDGE